MLSRSNTSTDENAKAEAFLASLNALTDGKVYFSRSREGPKLNLTYWGISRGR